MKREALPEIGDFVVCTVKEVKDFGAVVDLDEYPGKEGYIHVSEVASGWIKHIRDHVRESQKLVCKVTAIQEKRGHVDLSFKRVNEHQRRETISAWKNEQKAGNLMRILADQMGKEPVALYEQFGYDLGDEFGSLYAAFEAAALDDEALTKGGHKGAWVEKFIQIARDNIPLPRVTVTRYLTVTSTAPDGAERVKKSLMKGEECDYEDVQVEIQYVGAPQYRLRVTAPDYKAAEEEIAAAAERVIQAIQTHGGEGEIAKEQPA